MGTVPLVQSFLDPRNIATIFSYLVLGMLIIIALLSDGKERSILIIMVKYNFPNIFIFFYLPFHLLYNYVNDCYFRA